jgi:N-acyl homoserine lactone hydrolase
MSRDQKTNYQTTTLEDARVYILDTGHLECDANLVVSGTVVGKKQMKNPTIEWIKIPTYAVLIDHPERRILFDLGVRPGYVHPEECLDLFPHYHKDSQVLEHQLALAGYEPKDISAVVLSHLHWDHCGNLRLFDHAEIYFNPSELKSNPNIPPDISIKKPHFVEKDTEIVKGVKIITLPGHTVGVLGIVVHLKEDGTLIFASDAIYARGNYGLPAKLSGTVYDSLSYFKSVEKVRELEAKYNARVMFSHDMEFFETMKKVPEYYK